ncbi:hypothetical protein RFI_15256 [Reticulomyxa filosa]|uniref:Prenyltransferase n=1 Tax=Reticulomyxa filosa TaxID=46433 RepID=X6N7S3_RETFI|nr:hypothetical protein RFI_15256 [Reticulomyxa filosa]|eukprot:ETO21948.1 hypothetical protein RFI_15256 [Reticulomyxa filosa]
MSINVCDGVAAYFLNVAFFTFCYEVMLLPFVTEIDLIYRLAKKKKQSNKIMSKMSKENEAYSSSSSLKEKGRALMELGRLKFLAYSPIMYSIGAVVSCLSDGKPFQVKEYFIGIAVVYGLHAMTHFFNEYVDFDTDTINAAASPWTGGSQVLVKGLLPRKIALYAGLILIASVGVFVMYTFHAVSYHIYAVYVAVSGMILAGQYSLPPIRASRRCMGELWVTLVLNFLCPLESYLLQHSGDGSPFPSHVFWKCLIPIGKFVCFVYASTCLFFYWKKKKIVGIVEYVRMMVMNMNDIQADKAVNKITLPVFLGLNTSAKVHNVGMAFSYFILAVLYLFWNENEHGKSGIPTTVFVLLLLTLPFAYHYSRLVHVRPFRYELPFYASQHNCACMLAVYLGIVLDGIFNLHPNHKSRFELFFSQQYAACFLFPLVVLIPSLPVLLNNIRRAKFD